MTIASTSRRKFIKNSAMLGGAATLGGCATSSTNRSQSAPLFPEHNERTKGWLKFIWEKATRPDDWSIDGEPHESWDSYSQAPYFEYARFDLSDSSYPILLMADQTPAWREVYTRIMDELATRHTSYWAAIDWNTFIGPSPDRGNYTPQQMAMWPDRVKGNYDLPGWTGNGLEPWGLQRDPIAADGNLFFRGWLNLVLSIYKYISGDDKWEQPWNIAGYENEQFEWTQPQIVERLAGQYTSNPEGPHCENTKIWPICNSAAGLGIYLSDQLSGNRNHGAFENFVEYTKDNYMGINPKGELDWMTFFYDPVEDFKVNFPGAAGASIVAFYLLPQSPEIATFMYDAVANASGWRDPSRTVRPNTQGLIMAKALGDETVVRRLSAAMEEYADPRYFGDDNEKFAFWFNIDEPYPRGQGAAQAMISEIQEGSWADAFKVQHLDKYSAPTVEGVDFPTLGIDRAWNDKESGILYVGTYAADKSRRGEQTTWRVTGIPNAADVRILKDGESFTNFEVLNENSILVRSDVNEHQLQIVTNYHGQDFAVANPNIDPAMQYAGAASMVKKKATETEVVNAASNMMNGSATKCPCCPNV